MAERILAIKLFPDNGTGLTGGKNSFCVTAGKRFPQHKIPLYFDFFLLYFLYNNVHFSNSTYMT
jgi:hypothetical protein